jgi:hypothetical protein
MPKTFFEGDEVVKDGGDYVFHGFVVAAFRKREKDGTHTGPYRYVVQNLDGVLMIMNAGQIRKFEPAKFKP